MTHYLTGFVLYLLLYFFGGGELKKRNESISPFCVTNKHVGESTD